MIFNLAATIFQQYDDEEMFFFLETNGKSPKDTIKEAPKEAGPQITKEGV